MAEQFVSVKEFAEMQGVDQRTVRNWIRYDPPIPYRRGKRSGVEIPVKRGIAWRIKFELARRAAEDAPTGSAAKKRLEEIKLEREEIELRKIKGELILAHVHRQRMTTLTANFAGAVKAQLRRYKNDIVLADDIGAANLLLQRMEDEILDALQRTASGVSDDPPPDQVDDGAGNAAA